MSEPAFRIELLEEEKESNMDKLTQHVERLEEDTHQMKLDLAVLTARSENFATKADIAELRTELKADQYETRTVLFKEIADCEKRTNERFKRVDDKFESLEIKIGDINNRITWTLLIPALTAVILWFVKTAILQI